MPDHDEKEKIILRMDRSRTSRAFGEKESLWEGEISRILRLIKKHSDTLGNLHKDTGIDQMPLLSIGIFGSPGSGKSSLLRTLVSQYRYEAENSSGKDKLEYTDIYSLPVIKPNLVAKGDHFLYAFLAAALKQDRDINKGKSSEYQGSHILSQLQQAFQEVSEYLQVINEVEKTMENDPLGMSLERLERHESGLVLIDRMERFIDTLVSIYSGTSKASVVLLPVDDVDMEMETLVSVLDTYRRFLQHPRLVPVFTFTGRLAEELLRVHFENKLTVDGRFGSVEKLKEAATSLLLTENMAIQYLGRLFPVRNRIRLGPASARVLKAQYIPTSAKIDDSSGGGKPVLKLLELVSHLLYGHVDPNFTPGIRAPLRMLTLRRQFQIVDAMQDAKIDEFIKNKKNKTENDGSLNSWARAFDFATWTLLNTHRDILKEIDMNLDDLYGWTPQGLRHVVLRSMLNLEPQRRQNLLRRWLYHTEDRRSKVISLLAANVFRPRMPGEESTGDDIDIINWLSANKDEGNENNGNREIELHKRSFSTAHGYIWFLELCIGFYLPQILAFYKFKKYEEKEKKSNAKDEKDGERKRNGNGTEEEAHPGVISSVGWDLVNGPGLAVREALNNKRGLSNGILFLDTGEVRTLNDKLNIFIHTWCFYGYDEGRPWLAVSLWRGLALMGRLLRMYYYREKFNDKEKDKEQMENHILTLLNKHFESAMVLGRFPKLQKEEKYVSIIKKLNGKTNEIEKLSGEIQTWLKQYKPGEAQGDENRIFPMIIDELENKEDNQKEDKKEICKKQESWKNCFIQRIHGENILGEFLKRLDNSYFTLSDQEEKNNKEKIFEWDIIAVLRKWKLVLEEYWSGCESSFNKKEADCENCEVVKNSRNVKNLLLESPFLSCLNEKKSPKNKFWESTDLKELEKIKSTKGEELSTS